MRTAAVLAVGFVSLLALIQGISQAIAIGQRERALIPLLLGFVPSVLLASLIGQRFRGGEVHPCVGGRVRVLGGGQRMSPWVATESPHLAFVVSAGS